MKKIRLTKGFETLIDNEDYSRTSQFKWFAKYGGKDKVPYAARSLHSKGRCQSVRLHRFLTDCPKGMEVHHINGDTLDNRKENLMVCTKEEHSSYKGIK